MDDSDGGETDDDLPPLIGPIPKRVRSKFYLSQVMILF
jgi:hypothetical protein